MPNNQPDPRHAEGGIPFLPFAGIVWLIVVVAAELCCDMPRQAVPLNFGTGTLQVSKK